MHYIELTIHQCRIYIQIHTKQNTTFELVFKTLQHAAFCTAYAKIANGKKNEWKTMSFHGNERSIWSFFFPPRNSFDSLKSRFSFRTSKTRISRNFPPPPPEKKTKHLWIFISESIDCICSFNRFSFFTPFASKSKKKKTWINEA